MKTMRLFVAALVALVAAVSCRRAETEQLSGKAAPHTVSIHVDAVKTVISQDAEGHFKGAWEAGDVL